MPTTILSGPALSTTAALTLSARQEARPVDAVGMFMALDPATGKTVWEHKLMAGVATPVTYELDGTQYVAVMSGIAGGKVFAFTLDGP